VRMGVCSLVCIHLGAPVHQLESQKQLNLVASCSLPERFSPFTRCHTILPGSRGAAQVRDEHLQLQPGKTRVPM
jgi:hypothetical protein